MLEAQKKELDEAKIKIEELENAQTDLPVESAKKGLTTTQWLSVISIIISLAVVHYKREEIKGVFTKKTPVETPGVPPSSPVLPRAAPPPPSPVDAKRKVGIRKMD